MTYNLFQNYIKEIYNCIKRGDAREESFYGDLKNLLLSFAESEGKRKIDITVLPKKIEAGSPDFRLWDGMQNIVGYIEAKKPGEKLDVIEESEQINRYRKTFPNLILTDFFEFRLYRYGELIEKTFIARSTLAIKGIVPPAENEEKFLSLLGKFYSFSLPKVFTAEQLATELAKRTRFLRDEVISVEMEQERKGKGELYGFYDTFKKYLIANLGEKDFADLFSQTITYGLFAARTRSTNGFNRKLAYDFIPKTIGILRNVFKFISQGDLPKPMEVIIDDIAEVLSAADAKNILSQYYKSGKGEDPIIHFYETFLNEYDPATREKRGVYYTPEPVVRYIVRSVHGLLKTHFDLPDGLANEEVTMLDPAGGTLTFPAEAIKLAVKEYTDKYGDGGLNSFIRNHILKNFYSFELMMAPYAIGHIKISFLLEELGYQMKDNERFKLYLTNTLDMEDLAQTQIPGWESLSEESHLAGNVKKKEPILVIIGNPPYSGISANKNEWTEKLLKENIDGAQSYYEVDGKPLGERKLWLQDDYVKFLRFAQWKIQKAGQGVVGMITNHGYLDNPTFRGMRQSLLNTFNEIYLLDLHGNALKKETAPDGSKDENVFDIRQGVSIALFIKEKGKKGSKIYHSDLFGLRSEKYRWLEKHKFKPRDYSTLKPESPWYFFIPRDTKAIESFNEWKKVNEIFPVNNVGIVTARDHFAIDENKERLKQRIRMFRDVKRYDDDIIRNTFNLKDTSKFKLNKFRREFAKIDNWEGLIIPVLYRPFDKRYICYSKWIVERPIYETMKNMIKIEGNIALVGVRQVAEGIFNHAFISDTIIECRMTLSNKGTAYFYPLYVLPENDNGGNGDLFNAPKHASEPNIAEDIYATLKENHGNRLKPKQIFYYTYAVLYSNTYREKYSDFLKIDFPRIPFTNNYKLFLQMAEFGKQLTQLHLLKSKSLNSPTVKYKGIGEDVVERPIYNEKNGCIFINKTKFFDGISKDVWEYHIGGYQVLSKWLKDRQGKLLLDNEIKNYIKITAAIKQTIEIQKEIDNCFPEIQRRLITF